MVIIAGVVKVENIPLLTLDEGLIQVYMKQSALKTFSNCVFEAVLIKFFDLNKKLLVIRSWLSAKSDQPTN